MEQNRNNQTCWFAAHTRCGAELGVRDRLGRLGAEHFLPTELRSHTRGRAKYEKPLIPGLIFVRATKSQACALANEQGLPVRYLIDPATRSLMVVEGGLMDRPLALGDRVRVTKGALRGVEGHVLELRGQTYVVVELLGCWFARASVPRAWLERIDGPKNATH